MKPTFTITTTPKEGQGATVTFQSPVAGCDFTGAQAVLALLHAILAIQGGALTVDASEANARGPVVAITTPDGSATITADDVQTQCRLGGLLRFGV
jgi:hypothetical protein